MEDTAFLPLEIPKETVTTLRFPQEDVLFDEDEKEARKRDLMRALSLGNLEHQKILTYFEDDAGLKCVNTTFRAVTEKQVVLKYGNTIPIQRIRKIIF